MLSIDSPSRTLASRLFNQTDRHSLRSGVAPCHSGTASAKNNNEDTLEKAKIVFVMKMITKEDIVFVLNSDGRCESELTIRVIIGQAVRVVTRGLGVGQHPSVSSVIHQMLRRVSVAAC